MNRTRWFRSKSKPIPKRKSTFSSKTNAGNRNPNHQSNYYQGGMDDKLKKNYKIPK